MCIDFIQKVRDSKFIMIGDRQVNKFNRLTNKFNNRFRDRNNNSAQSTSSGNQMKDTYSINNGKSLKVAIVPTNG